VVWAWDIRHNRQPETLKIWVLSLHVCGQLHAHCTYWFEGPNFIQTVHKEEAQARISADQADREGLQKKLELCINPLDPEQYSQTIMNGMIGPSSVNVDETIDIGTRQMEEFESKLPDGFYDSVPMNAETMAMTKKPVKVADSKVYNTELIYSRVMGLQASSRDINIILRELSPVPTALFNDTEEMQISKSKSDLKNLTKIEVSARHPTPAL